LEIQEKVGGILNTFSVLIYELSSFFSKKKNEKNNTFSRKK